MVRKKSKKTVLPLLVIISAIIFTGLIGAITFQNIFPTTNPFITNESTVNLSYGIHAEDGLSSITHSWNGTNTTLYDSSLVLFYNFDNRSELGEMTNVTGGTLVRDLSMYENNGTIVGFNETDGFVSENATWISNGKNSGAFKLVSGAWINTTKSSVGINNFTMSIWVNQLDSYVNATTAAIFYTSGGTANRQKISINNNTRQVEYSLSNCSSQGKTVISLNNWHHLVLTFDGLNTSRFYVDGVLVNTCILTYVNSNLFYKIGDSVSTEWFNGSYDEPMVWNRSLSTREVNTLYNTQITKFNESYFQYNTTKNVSYLSQSSFICSKNATLIEFCDSTQNNRQLFNLKSNFSNNISVVRNDFYGVTDQYLALSDNDRYGLDKDCDDVIDANFDTSYNRNLFLNSNMKSIRLWNYDMDSISISEGVYNQTNIKSLMDEAKFANDNNMRIYFLFLQPTPNWLANQTTGWCNISGSGANNTCPPTNITKLVNIYSYVLNNLTQVISQDKIDFTPINEPYNENWLNNLSYDNIIKATEYVKVYNESYNTLKATYPNISIGGPSGKWMEQTNMETTFLSNASTGYSIDFIGIHPYAIQGYSYKTNLLVNQIANVLNNCTTYSLNCNRIIVAEFSMKDNYLVSNSNYSAEIAFVYQSVLNYLPNNVSLIFYQWGNKQSYDDCSTLYNEYPLYYDMYNEVDNEITPPYNVTKSFAHLCPAGATVYVTSNDDDTIKQVSCKKGNQYSLIIINTDTNAKNVTLNLSMNNGTVVYPYRKLLNYETEEQIPISSTGIAQLGVLDSYGILYLRSGEESGATLRGIYKLNEYSGNTVYDSRINISNGTKSGASWVTDGVLNKIPTSKYTINLNSGLTSLSNDYLYEYLTVSYNTVVDKTSLNALTSIENSGSTAVNFLPLVFLVAIFGAILFLVLRFLSPYIELGQNINNF